MSRSSDDAARPSTAEARATAIKSAERRVTVVHGPLPPRSLTIFEPDVRTYSPPKKSDSPIVADEKPIAKDESKGAAYSAAVQDYRQRRLLEELHGTKSNTYSILTSECDHSFHTRTPVLQRMSRACPRCGKK